MAKKTHTFLHNRKIPLATEAQHSLVALQHMAIVNASTETKILDNKEHLVVPVIAVKEGVLNSLYYSASEIADYARMWNGVPISVGHPASVNNSLASANTPENHASINIGTFYNTYVENDALKGEIWIDIEKATRLNYSEIVNTFKSGEMMEVSTGLFAEVQYEMGNFNNKAYTGIVKNMHPDHLALLPNEVGACSIDDGCGAMRNNAKEACCGSCASKNDTSLRQKFSQAVNTLAVKFGLKTNELSHNDLYEVLRKAIRNSMPNDDVWIYIVDVFDSYFVYDMRGDYYQQAYNMSDDVTVNLVGEPMMVSLKKTYVPIANNKEVIMNKQQMVDMLIANSNTQYAEADKPILLALDNELLKKMLPNEAEADSKPEVQAQADNDVPADKPEATQEKDALSKDERAHFNRLMQQENARVDTMRKQVQAGYKLTENAVKAMAVDALEELANGLKTTPDYSAQAGGKIENAEKRVPAGILLGNSLDEKETVNG